MAGFIQSFDIYGNLRMEYRPDLPGIGDPDVDVFSVEAAAALGVVTSMEDATTEVQRDQYKADEAAQTKAFNALMEANAQAAIVRNVAGDSGAAAAQRAYQETAAKTLTTVVESPVTAHQEFVDLARAAVVGQNRIDSVIDDDLPKVSTAPAPDNSGAVAAGFFFLLAKILFF